MIPIILLLVVSNISQYGCPKPSCCPKPSKDAPIIAKYNEANCISPSDSGSITPPVREWDTTLRLKNGTQVEIKGEQLPGHQVDAYYEPQPLGGSIQITPPAFYIYSSDVRLDHENEILYVKTDGVIGRAHQTWLFSFDLAKRTELERVCVVPSSLPPECKKVPSVKSNQK
jgi:hypothetical protein